MVSCQGIAGCSNPKGQDEIYLYRVVVSGGHLVGKPKAYEGRIIGGGPALSVDFTCQWLRRIWGSARGCNRRCFPIVDALDRDARTWLDVSSPGTFCAISGKDLQAYHHQRVLMR
jgi:hypothetical protein